MEEIPSTKSGRWLYVFGATYLILFLFMRPDQETTAHIRWIGFFILTQGLIQIIFPQFRCSRSTNFSVATLLIITTIVISLDS